MPEEILKIRNVSKKYRLGMIGGTTLRDELQRRRAKRKGIEDPTKSVADSNNAKVGDDFLALDGINITVYEGERVGLIGHNGAGKSTLLKLISRITAPTTGSIQMNGRIASMLEVGTGFHPELTGRENIYLNGAILGMTRKEIESKIENIIEFSECRRFIDTPVKRYSSGMYVKLAFSVAAHLDSEIMIMDEVLAVGDMAFQKKCLDKMSEVSKSEGKTILYVSHNMNTIRQLCERVIVLDHGQVVFDGDAEEGIGLYLDSSQSKGTAKLDLDEMKHFEEGCSYDIRMLSLNLVNKSIPAYDDEEALQMSMDIRVKKDIDNIRFRMTVRTADDYIVGTTWSNLLSFKKCDCENLEILFDLDTLSPGKYNASFGFYKVYESGRFDLLDYITKAFEFEIQPKARIGKLIWSPSYWGHTVFPEARMKIKNG